MIRHTFTPTPRNAASYAKAGTAFEYACPRCGGRMIRPRMVHMVVCWLCGHIFNGTAHRAAAVPASVIWSQGLRKRLPDKLPEL